MGRRAGAVVRALQLEARSADDEQADRPAEDLEDLVTQTNRKTNMANEQTSGGLLPLAEEKPALTVAEVAEILDCCVTTVHRKIRAGIIPISPLSGAKSTRVLTVDLRRLMGLD